MSLEFHNQVKQYLAERIDLEDYDARACDQLGLFHCAFSIFKQEKYYEIIRVGERQALADWFAGLPTAIQIDFTYSDIFDLLTAWEAETGEGLQDERKNELQEDWFMFLADHFLTIVTNQNLTEVH
jgi:hypothetical protein